MSAEGKRATIRDVAQLAGVSTASVSKVLNHRAGVSKKTQEAVLKATRQLNYTPNSVARSLRARRSHTIGIITDDIEGVFTTALVRGVEDISQEQGFSVFLCNSYGDSQRERVALEVLLAKQVDGIILMSGYRVRERGAPMKSLGSLPLVYLYQYTNELSVPCIIPDDRGGGYLGTHYLIELGHRRIGLVNGPVSYEATHLRLEGYRQALTEADLPFDANLIGIGEWNQTAGYNLTHELLSLPNPPTAIFCMSDLLAVGAADAIHDRRLRIPENVSLLGFDDRFFAVNQRPPLATVALPLYEMGKLAGEVLISQIHNKNNGGGIQRVPCTLVERESCAPYWGAVEGVVGPDSNTVKEA